jgi:hypothetical protein
VIYLAFTAFFNTLPDPVAVASQPAALVYCCLALEGAAAGIGYSQLSLPSRLGSPAEIWHTFLH